MTQFVLVYAAIMHNVNDYGEDNKSSPIERAWSLLMEPTFKDLRACLFEGQNELDFARRLLIKSAMAMATRQNGQNSQLMESADFDQKASQNAMYAIEQLLQVSDVSHALQHFSVFTKWNKLLFKEMHLSYKSGRAKDPSGTWYENETKLFDSRIALAKRLRDCQIFSKTADVYLNAAITNKREWEKKGKSLIQDYLLNYAATQSK